jgi:hypothetical protein
MRVHILIGRSGYRPTVVVELAGLAGLGVLVADAVCGDA